MSQTATVRMNENYPGVSKGTLGKVVFEEGDRQSNLRVIGTEGNTYWDEMWRNGHLRDREDFLTRCVGGRGTTVFTWDEPVAKADTTAYTIRADQSGEAVGKVYVSDNALVGYDGDIPPMGYQDGKAIGDFMDENRGYVLTPVADSVSLEVDADDVVDNEAQARLVGTAVGSALLASGVISKADEEQQVVYGWAYVTHDREGNVVVDKSGDFVDDIGEIEKTAIDFMLHSRMGDTDHSNKASTTIVESMVFTPEKMAAMGIAKGTMPSGWWIGAKCDDETWAGYMAGRWKAFSVHGSGTRKSVD